MRPFLKWAGGKYRLRSLLLKHLPAGKRLLEPFVGSGAVCLNTHYDAYFLADSNPDLIYLYQFLQKEQLSFIDHCQRYFQPRTNTRTRYYALRDEFNQTQDPHHRAILFLYLNRHGYNGLCRYNSQGYYNVPFGFYPKPYFPRREMENFCQYAISMEFQCADFEKTLQCAKPGDVVYCDPPYVPLSTTSAFTRYAQQDFGEKQQCALAKAARALQKKGITVVISNHDTPLTRELYHAATLHSFDVSRSISCQGDQRKPVRELLAVFG